MTIFLKKNSVITFWIANYNFIRKNKGGVVVLVSEKASVNGIKGNVDVNIYNGDLQQLRYITFTICIRYFGRVMLFNYYDNTITKRQPK
jgi:hypothetical protein